MCENKSFDEGWQLWRHEQALIKNGPFLIKVFSVTFVFILFQLKKN